MWQDGDDNVLDIVNDNTFITSPPDAKPLDSCEQAAADVTGGTNTSHCQWSGITCNCVLTCLLFADGELDVLDAIAIRSIVLSG